MEGVVWTYMGSNIDSFKGSEVVIPAKASADMLPALKIFSIAHSSNCCKESHTFIKYWDMRSSLTSYSFGICPMMS